MNDATVEAAAAEVHRLLRRISLLDASYARSGFTVPEDYHYVRRLLRGELRRAHAALLAASGT